MSTVPRSSFIFEKREVESANTKGKNKNTLKHKAPIVTATSENLNNTPHSKALSRSSGGKGVKWKHSGLVRGRF